MQQEVERNESPRKPGDSQLLKNLMDYSITPDENLKRKLDYFYTPYNKQFYSEKYMKFDESADQMMVFQKDKRGKIPEEFKDPFKQKQILTNALWTKIKDKIFDTEKEVLKGLHRHVQITMLPTEDYLTKLDLIDTHPELFKPQLKNVQLTKQEIEMLRQYTINKYRGTKKLFASRSPKKITEVKEQHVHQHNHQHHHA